MNPLLSCLREESAVTALEYALVASLLALVVVASIGFLGDQVVLMYNNIRDHVVPALL